MDHSVSMDEVPNPLQPPMQQPQVGGGVACEDTTTTGYDDATDRSPSEWSFERLLEQELMGNTTPPAVDSSAASVFHIEEPVPDDAVEVEPATTMATGSGMADPVEYNAMLKRKLEEDLAAIAMWRASGTHQENSQGSYAYNGENRNLAQNKFIDSRGHLAQNSCICVNSKLPARSSSMEPSPSDDDDMDGEVEIMGLRMPDAEKMKKRKASNRESARRSRTRKAAHMKDLEDQVTHLRVENSLLLRRLDAMNQKYNVCAVDNRILRADIETLRTKVKMAEDTVNRLMGRSSPSFSSMPFVGHPSHATLPADPSVPIQDNNIDITNYYTAEGAVNGSSNTNTINRVAASHCTMAAMEELLQERVISAMPSSSAADGAAPLGLDVITDANMEARH